MADNVAITAGSGTTIATDERTINSATVHIQRVDEIGSSAIANGHVTISNTAANIAAARDTRKRLVVINNQKVPVYVGAATVTTSNGIYVPPGASLVFYTTAAVQGITSAAYSTSVEDEKVHYWEEYNA